MAYPVAPSTGKALAARHTEVGHPHLRPPAGRPRRPEKTVVYQLVQEHLETWLACMREAEPDGDPIPRFVERDLRKHLECGILARGFGRARCGGCGHDFLIAYSCKGRGVCPSCNTRRMAETAAHLVDHVFPQVPVRQWVLSLPKRLRYFLHHEPALIGPVLQIFLDAVEDRLKVSSPGALAEALRGSDLCPSLRLGIECQPPLSLCGHRWCLRCPRGKGAISRSSAALSCGHRRRATRGAYPCAAALRAGARPCVTLKPRQPPTTRPEPAQTPLPAATRTTQSPTGPSDATVPVAKPR
jgi:hypothetical protein